MNNQQQYPAGKPKSNKPKARRCHPWRVWIPKVEKKPGEEYASRIFTPTIPASNRMGLSL